METKKIDSSFKDEKINLRWMSLPDKNIISVLDCFAGTGYLWNQVKKRTSKEIKVLSIDTNPRKPGTLKGDNVKYLKALDLSMYDIIDLDAYGIPFRQCKVLFDRKYIGIVHVTIIRSGLRTMPTGLAQELGYTKKMYKKSPTLISTDGINKMLTYLAQNGIRSIRYQRFPEKFYGYFKTGNDKSIK